MKKLKKILDYVLGLPKSVYINFRLCTPKDAWKLPIIVSRKVKLSALTGNATFDKVRTGIVRIGFGSVETVDYRYERTILFIEGNIHFKGKAKIGKGSRLSITGKTTFGNNFHISSSGTIICRKEIHFGDNVLIAWDSLITDTDHHHIYQLNSQKYINENKPLKIGNHCWIGARSNILKGVELADNVIVGYCAVVTKSIKQANVCIAGNPAKIIKENVYWQE